jgi:hypothetical protein
MVTSAYNASHIVQPIQSTSTVEQILSSLLDIQKHSKRLVQDFNNILITIGIAIFALLACAIILPILPISYISILVIFKALSKKITSVKELLKRDIEKVDFNNIKELEKQLIVLRDLSEYLLNNTSKNIFSKSFLSSVASIKNDSLEMVSLCSSQYKFKEEEMNLSPEELVEYKKAFAEFSDIWNYETPEEDYKDVFSIKKTHKKKLA